MNNLQQCPLRCRLIGEQLESRYLLSAVGFVARDTTIDILPIYAADLDGDGDVDVLSRDETRQSIRFAWYENTDGKGAFGPHNVILTDGGNFDRNHVFAADVDGDGDVDVLSTSFRDDKIAWYENTDGKGTFGVQQVITTQADNPRGVYAADVDSDGDVDVLSASISDAKIAWYENTDGKGTFGEQQVITTMADSARSVYATDVDGDGDVDVLSASHDKIAWYENTDGKGAFGVQRVITTQVDSARWVYAADVDGDGDVDVLSASQLDAKIAWYENTDGKGTFGEQRVITTQVDFSVSVYAADVDGDGDVDIFSGWPIAWYENTDGKGTFGEQQVISSHGYVVNPADVDGDGDVDVLEASLRDGRITWYENRLAGDADDNGEVAFADFLKLSSNFGSTEATWDQGDFDGNGKVDFSDFLILANNFGMSRQLPAAPTMSADSQRTEILQPVAAAIQAADELFQRFDDELTLDNLL